MHKKLIVQTSGTPDVSGVYTLTGTSNGAPYYSNGTYYLYKIGNDFLARLISTGEVQSDLANNWAIYLSGGEGAIISKFEQVVKSAGFGQIVIGSNIIKRQAKISYPGFNQSATYKAYPARLFPVQISGIHQTTVVHKYGELIHLSDNTPGYGLGYQNNVFVGQALGFPYTPSYHVSSIEVNYQAVGTPVGYPVGKIYTAGGTLGSTACMTLSPAVDHLEATSSSRVGNIFYFNLDLIIVDAYHTKWIFGLYYDGGDVDNYFIIPNSRDYVLGNIVIMRNYDFNGVAIAGANMGIKINGNTY